MNLLVAWRVLAPVDARNVWRDPMLKWLILYPLGITLLFRFAIAPVTERLQTQWGFDAVPYYPLCASFLLIMTPMLGGMVVGFLLLDQHDDQTLTAIQVTPLGLEGYLLYRLMAPSLVSALVTLAVVPASGILELGAGATVLATLVAAPLAPIYALTLAGFADNKVQGFALAKALGIFLVPPVIAYLVKEPWQWLFGLDPLYWTTKLVWESQLGNPFAPLYSLPALLYEAGLLVLLLRLFRRSLT